MKNGQIDLTIPSGFQEGEVDIIINEPDQFEHRHQIMREKGYDSPEKIMELIHTVKLEILK